MASYVFRLFFILVFVVSWLVVQDLKKHGSLAGSQTELFLKDPQKYTKLALLQFRSYSQQVYRWSQKNIPRYISQIREGCIPFLHKMQEVLIAWILLLWNNITLACQYFLDKAVAHLERMDRTAPGLSDSIALWLSRTWAFVCDYSLQLATLIVYLLSAATQWLRDNVLVVVLRILFVVSVK